MGVRQLQRNPAIERSITAGGQPHLTHTAAAKTPLQQVRSHLLTVKEFGRRRIVHDRRPHEVGLERPRIAGHDLDHPRPDCRVLGAQRSQPLRAVAFREIEGLVQQG
jgi:hypothetical protein